jgi:hypothetical protein
MAIRRKKLDPSVNLGKIASLSYITHNGLWMNKNSSFMQNGIYIGI